MHSRGGNRGAGATAGGNPPAADDTQARARQRGRASQRIVERLRLQIRQGELVPGDRLPAERELCEQYGVSRVTIREALRVLEASGLVDIRLGSHGGAFVTSPTAAGAATALEDYFTLSDITPHQIHELRGIIELGLVPLACERASEDELDQLTRTYDEAEAAWQEGRAGPRPIHDFYVHLASTAGNTAASMLLRPLYASEQAGDGAGTTSRRTDIDEHRELVEAVRQRDVDRAKALMRTLVRRSAPS